MRRSYSDKEKANALAILDANEGNLNRTSQQVGIPRKTLSEWARDRFVNTDVAEIRQEKKKELADELEDIAYTIAGVMPHFAHNPFNKINELSTALGTVIDKMRLLRGESTNITETRAIDRGWAEQQLADLMAECAMSRDAAIAILAENAPTVAKWLN